MFIENYNDDNGHFSTAKYCEIMNKKVQGKLFFANCDIKCYDGIITAGSIVALECRERQGGIDFMVGVFNKEEALKGAIYINEDNALFERTGFISSVFQYHKVKHTKNQCNSFLESFGEAISEEESLDLLLSECKEKEESAIQKKYEVERSIYKMRSMKKTLAVTIPICLITIAICIFLFTSRSVRSNVLFLLFILAMAVATTAITIFIRNHRIISKANKDHQANSINSYEATRIELANKIDAVFSGFEHYYLPSRPTNKTSPDSTTGQVESHPG